uniref:Uncharacterized protein n=1 Tax=Callithrix jacchus TaxID=9483 RepID=A0A8I3WCG2_CALJA
MVTASSATRDTAKASTSRLCTAMWRSVVRGRTPTESAHGSESPLPPDRSAASSSPIAAAKARRPGPSHRLLLLPRPLRHPPRAGHRGHRQSRHGRAHAGRGRASGNAGPGSFKTGSGHQRRQLQRPPSAPPHSALGLPRRWAASSGTRPTWKASCLPSARYFSGEHPALGHMLLPPLRACGSGLSLPCAVLSPRFPREPSNRSSAGEKDWSSGESEGVEGEVRASAFSPTPAAAFSPLGGMCSQQQ